MTRLVVVSVVCVEGAISLFTERPVFEGMGSGVGVVTVGIGGEVLEVASGDGILPEEITSTGGGV